MGGGEIGRKEREKKGRQKKGKRKKNGEEQKKEKEKRVGMKYLNKRKYCVGTEPSALYRHSSTGQDGSVVSALASQAKGRGSIPSCGTSFFFPTSIFYLPFPTSVE